MVLPYIKMNLPQVYTCSPICFFRLLIKVALGTEQNTANRPTVIHRFPFPASRWCLTTWGIQYRITDSEWNGAWGVPGTAPYQVPEGAQASEEKKVLLSQSSSTLSTPCTVARQAPLPMGVSRHEYWSGLPFPSPGYLPNPAIKPRSPHLAADSLPSESPGKSGHLSQVIIIYWWIFSKINFSSFISWVKKENFK